MWTPDPSIIITEEQKAAAAHDAAWSALRAERDRHLAETDWLVLRNLETSEPVAPEWLAYRQALRDMPENTDDPLSPVWPDVPAD